MLSRAWLLGVVSVLAVAGCGDSHKTTTGLKPPSWAITGRYAPSIHRGNFVRVVRNPYFPLIPGTHYHYVGHKGRARQSDDMVVTQRTKRVLGIRCTVVSDTVSQHGRPIERTFDWYAQDRHGNVWYMGEDSLERHHGRFVKASDSWKAGVHGAKPGIIMPGHPRAGDVYRQEYYPAGKALDQAHVLARRPRVTVPFGTFKHPLATIEWSPTEPQFEKKYYALSVGEIAERVTRGGHEQFKLANVTPAPVR
jgi:hypothetical protein